VSRFLTAQQYNLGHLVPLRVENEERESNHIIMLREMGVLQTDRQTDRQTDKCD